jgi:hypothetical protein
MNNWLWLRSLNTQLGFHSSSLSFRHELGIFSPAVVFRIHSRIATAVTIKDSSAEGQLRILRHRRAAPRVFPLMRPIRGYQPSQGEEARSDILRSSAWEKSDLFIPKTELLCSTSNATSPHVS